MHGGGGGFGGFDGGGMHGGGGLDWAAYMTIPILIFVLIGVALAAYVAWKMWKADRPAASATGAEAAQPTQVQKDAQAVLAERLATGEIGPDDYTRRMEALRPGSPGEEPTQPGA